MRRVGPPLAWGRVGSVLVLVVGVFGLPVRASTHLGSPAAGGADSKDRARVEAMLGKLPLYFVENRGQEDSRVAFSLPGRDTTLYFTRDGVTFALTGPRPHRSSEPFARVAASRSESTARERWSVKLDFVGANPAVVPRGQDPTPAPVSYFKGPESQWKTGLLTYASVVYADLWPGIDMVYSGTAGRLKYTLFVQPGADPERIKLAYRGATGVKVTEAGLLEVSTPVGGFSDDQPYAYQESGGGRNEIPAAYVLAADSRTYSFKVGAYDRSRPLVLDPSFLDYAGYIGGSNGESAVAIAVDSAGNAYVAGSTTSTVPSFPGSVGPDLIYNGGGDAFVAKVKADGTGLVYAGYIGGEFVEGATAIAVDSAGNAYVAGQTFSDQTTFPVKGGPSLTNSGGEDVFVAKVKADGTDLVYAGFIGGAGEDLANCIAVDSAGNAYVGGFTSSDETTFPVKVGPDLVFNRGFLDAFVAKVKADGTGLVYAGYIGGAGFESVNGIAVDSAGNAYVAGETDSDQTTFPVRVGPVLTFNGGDSDAFVAKVKADGTGLVYAGYIGGAGLDAASAIDVDSAGNAYVGGRTNSDQTTFPVKVGPDLIFNGATDAFVAKVKPDGTGLVYAGYIGGAGFESANGIAVDSAGNAYVTGTTDSTTGFPIRVGPDLFNNGGNDIFVAKVRADGTGLLYAGFIGGLADDRGNAIAVDSAGNAYIAGFTTSDQTTFPVTVGPDLLFNGGGSDAFVLKVSGKPNLLEGALTIPSVAKRGGSFLVSSLAINQGLGTAPASTTRYYLSLDDAKSGGDILLAGSKAVPSLVPSGVAVGSATVTIPNTTPLGLYFVLACADDPHAVAELDETDNCGPSSGRMSVTLPDLHEVSLSQPPSSANPGNQFNVTDFVHNAGAVAAGASTTRYYLSTDTVKSADDFLLTGSRAVGALNPNGATGSISSGTVTVTIPSATPLGTYHLIACADDLHVVAETNETNNCLGSSGTMNLSSPAFDPTVALKPPGRVATVIVLATCTDGAQVHLTVSITQGDAFGEGNAIGQCTGNPERYPVTVSAQGSTRFAPGPAEVHGEAIVKDHGEVLDDHTWTRVLNLVLTP